METEAEHTDGDGDGDGDGDTDTQIVIKATITIRPRALTWELDIHELDISPDTCIRRCGELFVPQLLAVFA